MASGNVIVTKTVNRTTFEVDKGSYNRAVKQIRQVGKEWEKASTAISKPNKDPAKVYDKSAAQMRLVNKRLADTRIREEKRATNHAIAMAKKEARAKESIAKVSAARIRQQMKTLTAKNQTMSDMKKFYQQQERAAKAAGRKASAGSAIGRSPKISRAFSMPGQSATPGTGMVGTPKVFSPGMVARQNAAMARHHKSMFPPAADPAAQAKIAAEARKAAATAARRDDIISQQRIRLSSKYGRGYGGRLGQDGSGQGISDLNKQFRSGSLSAGQYRQSIQSLERQFRSAQAQAGGFGSALGDLRSQLTGAAGAYGVFAAGSSVLRQGQFFQGLDATMTMVSDSSEEATKRIKFLKDQAYALGLDLKIASQGYVQMSVNATGILDKSQTDDLFKGFSEYSTALQVDPVKFQRGITAIGQMMGKGQIMAEELKGQLAEGIPGSLQVFVKASQEAFNDTTIDVEKLMAMMQKGELKAAKVLPFVAKYFAEAARKGGALDKAINSNRVAMQQMQQTWINFQNAVFEGGFGEQMTRVFRDLATILNSNGELATNLGRFFGNVIEGFWDMVTEIHDDFVFLDRIFEYYVSKLGVQGDLLKDIFDWGAYLLGMGLFIKSLSSILGILTKIAGLRGAITAIRGAIGGDLAAAGGTGARAAGTAAGAAGRLGPGGMGPPSPGGFGSAISRFSGLGKFAKLGILGTAYSAGEQFYGSVLQRGDDKLRAAGVDPNQKSMNILGRDLPMAKPVGLLDVWDDWFNKPRNLDKPTISPGGISNSASVPSGIPFPMQPTKVEGQVTIKIEAGELKNIVRGIVDENERFNLNMLMQGGS